MDVFEEIALELHIRKKINVWGIDSSLLKDGVYHGCIKAPIDIIEFKGFEEEFGVEINEVRGSLSFYECESLTSVGVLPHTIGGYLSFGGCKSLTSIGVLPHTIGGSLNFSNCTSLTSIGVLPQNVGGIYTYGTTFFENMSEKKIRKKYGIKYE